MNLPNSKLDGGAVTRQGAANPMQMTPEKAVEFAGKLFGEQRYEQAERVCQQIIQQTPGQADAYNILGATLNALGRRKEAVAMFKRAIKLAPKTANFHSNLGEVERQRGNLGEAVLCFQKAIELDPGNFQAHNNMGIVHYERKQWENAIQSYNRALELNPRFSEAYNNLGNACMSIGDHEGALKAYENALIHREIYPEAYNNLGIVLRELGKLTEAEHVFRKAIAQNPHYLDAHNNLAELYSWMGNEIEALRVLTDALKISPRNPKSLIITARIQLNRANFPAAEQACAIALQDDPHNVEAMTVLGHVLHETDRYQEAIDILERALADKPDHAEARNFYGVALKSVGRLDDARSEIFKAIKLNGRMFGAYANLHDLVDFSQEDELFNNIEQMMEGAPDKNAPHMLPLHYAYANALDARGQHETALEHFVAGGKLKRAQLKYNEKDTETFFSSIAEAFPAEMFRDRALKGNPSDRPLFIVGMPRSGSTLVEQIISSHADVYGAGEIKYLNRALGTIRDRFPTLPIFPEFISNISQGQFDILGGYYMTDLVSQAGDAKRVTDKLLTNYFFVGMINLLFPNAKIIWTLRDPVDTCLSAFTKLFKDDMPHSYDLGELGRYYGFYYKLMKHWQNVLPEGVLLPVQYEDVVANTEQNARRLIEFVGLPWDDACLEFYNSKRPVKTASVAQVRKPIYKSSVERWKKYGGGLQELIAEIDKFKEI